MIANRPQALIIDDEPDLLSLLSISLTRMGVDSVKANSVESARKKLSEQSFDLCLTDLRLPDGSGLDIVRFVRENYTDTPVAVITAFGDPKTAVEALKSGAFDYVSKPLELNELHSMVETALRVVPEDASPFTIINSSNDLLGQSEPIKRIRKIIAKVARSQAPVHIFGETGTGKELIARLIHENGPRSEAPFIAVNCGAIPRELMESEFFGHKKGSFTGAHADSEGMFRAAHGGTLFLDEVGDLPIDLQVKLLRAIQEKRIRAVGDSQELPVNIRLISATNKILGDMISTGEFREDFYYRINVIPILAPPLRKRPEDIAILADHILDKLATEHLLDPPEIEDSAIELLSKYPFPGNVRELENILERSIALNEGESISAANIILPDSTTLGDIPINETLPIDEQVSQTEIALIKKALAESGGNITAAAKILGTSFRSLRYRIKKLGIS